MRERKKKKRERSDWFATWLKYVSKVRMEKKGVVAPTFVAKSAEELREGRERREDEKKISSPD